jgi:Legionella pneumophila major outer membrane protein precursor
MKRSRQILLASVSSIVVLAVAAPGVMAADLPAAPEYIAVPPPVPAAPAAWTWWIEGGAQQVLGDPFVPGLVPSFDAKARNWGATGGGGFAYRFTDVWVLDFDFRFGATKGTTNSTQIACLGTPTFGCFTPLSGPNTATHKEDNWAADFMVGRDIGLGGNTTQIEGGLRIAEIRGKTDGNTVLHSATGFATSINAYSQKNYFFGIGPRVAVDGNVPLGGPWSLQYMVGVAGLFAHRSTDQTASFTTVGVPTTCLPYGCALNGSTSSDGFIFNPDAMIGIAYAFSPTVKLTANYRIDAYFDALRVLNAAGVGTYTNRIYHGPNLRLTWQFP